MSSKPQSEKMQKLNHELHIEIEDQCLSIWRELCTKRPARVTLLVEFDDQFVIVTDPSNGFWFLPGGGVEKNESVEDTAKREAQEELGIEVNVTRILKTFHVTLVSKKAKEKLRIPPFIVVRAAPLGKKLKREYAPNRKIVLAEKRNCEKLLQDFKVPRAYECMKPYYYVSKEVVREILTSQKRS